MKKTYVKPSLDSKVFAHLESVFTYCTKSQTKNNCINVTGTGNDSDKVGKPSDSNAHSNLPYIPPVVPGS